MPQERRGAWSLLVIAALVIFGVGLEGCGGAGEGPEEDPRPVLVTGATGRTGALIYGLLKEAGIPARAWVRSASKAREKLNCTACDEDEGIFVGDLSQPESLAKAVAGAGALVVATSAVPQCTFPSGGGPPNCTYPEGGTPYEIDWVGANAQLSAFANATAPALDGPLVLISTLGTTSPVESLPGNMAFYKLNFEASVMASGLPFAILKPCGLWNAAPRKAQLLVGHDDSLLDVSPPLVPRSDVARVAVAALQRAFFTRHIHLRFDLCSRSSALGGQPTTDDELQGLLEEAQYNWARSSVVPEAIDGVVNI